MKAIITLLILLTLSLISCAAPRWQLQANCSHDKSDVIAGLTALVTQEGMNVTLVNEKIGLLQAASPEHFNVMQGYLTDTWQFTISNDTIFAFAKTLIANKNLLGMTTSTAEISRNDKNMSESSNWYWNVRNGIQALCDNAVITFVKR